MLKNLKQLLLVGVLIASIFISGNNSFSASEVTKSTIGDTIEDTFPDYSLSSCVATELGKKRTDPVSQTELDGISTLSCQWVDNIDGIDLLTNINDLGLRAGDIENIDLLAGLTNLTKLNLYDNKIEDISALAGLTNLTSLDLGTNAGGNEISDISVLSGLTKLTSLDLSSNQINDISVLSGLTNLTSLNISTYVNGNEISDISALSGLTNLTELNISQNPISDISMLSGLTNLTDLNIGYTHKISDISALSGLTNLTRLDISGNPISDISVLSGLTNLTNLQVRSNQISDISAVSGLNELTYLDMDRNQISDISSLSGLTNLTTLKLDNNQIGDISSLSGLANLKTLYLDNNQIGDISSLSGLANLKMLYLDNNQIGDISSLSGLTNLTTLYLDKQTIDLGVLLMSNTKIPAPISVSLKAMDDSEFTSGMVDYEFLNGETVDGNEININENLGTPIDFEDGIYSGTIKFTRVEDRPTISTPGDSTINEGDSLDILDQVSATDPEDGDITSAITVSNPDNFKGDGKDAVGTYTITYTVTDSDGNISTVKRIITVTAKPIINQPGDTTITEGNKLDVLDKVTATDVEDGDLTSAITVSNPDNFKGDGKDAVGTYTITYTVLDSDGNTVSVKRTITVVAKEVVDPIDGGGTDSGNTDDTNAGSTNDTNAGNTENIKAMTIVKTGLNSHIKVILMAVFAMVVAIVAKYSLNRKVSN